MKDPLRIILHLIAFCIAFYCQLDLQWDNYTMLVFLFYYASVFDFPKYKKRYIALCHGSKLCFLPWSGRTSLQTHDKSDLEGIWSRFVGFCCTSRWEKPKTTVNVLKSAIINLGKTQEYVIIYQELNLKRIDSTSAKAGEVLNAGSTGEKHRVMNLYICQTGISGVYLLVSRKV